MQTDPENEAGRFWNRKYLVCFWEGYFLETYTLLLQVPARDQSLDIFANKIPTNVHDRIREYTKRSIDIRWSTVISWISVFTGIANLKKAQQNSTVCARNKDFVWRDPGSIVSQRAGTIQQQSLLHGTTWKEAAWR